MVGDTHGNIHWLNTYIYPVAMTVGADKIVVLGDYGAWEHTPAGVEFMNGCDTASAVAGIPLYWLHGNHDKWSHTMARYGGDLDHKGFVICRENVFYIPQGHSWTWAGVAYRSFGGAYSIDKSWRVKAEAEKYQRLLAAARSTVGNGGLWVPETVPSQTGTLWFPEEEMTDDEMDLLLREDWHTKDVILSHDKPMSANPDWGRKSYPACVPNQLRLERAMRLHKPDYWLHGHLHYHYTDRVQGSDWETTVIGLNPDIAAREHEGWKRSQTWALVETTMAGVKVSVGDTVTLDAPTLMSNKLKVHAVVDH